MLGTLCALLAVLSAPPVGGPEQAVEFSVWAVQALHTGNAAKQFDGVAQAVRKAIEDLPYDTFRGIYSGVAGVSPGSERRLPLDDTYTLLIQCRKRDGKDSAHIDLCVEISPSQAGAAPRKAIQTSMTVCTGKKVRIGGLKMKEGEMVVVLEMTG